MNTVQKKNLLLFNFGRFISSIGSSIQYLAIPLYILDKTGLGIYIGIFTLISKLPLLIMTPFAGVLGDRWNRKRILILNDLGRGIIIFILAILSCFNIMNIAILFCCQVLISVMDSLYNASTLSILPQLVNETDYNRSNATSGGIISLSYIVGPVLFGIIYTTEGIQMIFFINACSFIISAICETFISYYNKINKTNKINIKIFINKNLEVLTLIKHNIGLKQLLIYSTIVNFFAIPILIVILPFLLKKVIGFSSLQYSYLMTSLSVGVLLGNIIIGFSSNKLNTGKLMKLGIIIEILLLILLSFIVFPPIIFLFKEKIWSYFIVIGTTLLIVGLFNASISTSITTNFQKIVPDKIRSRFFLF